MSRYLDLLLVEDNRDEVDVALRALRRSGLEASIEVARDGQEALVALGLEPDGGHPSIRPRVVFLDLKMPRIDGWEVLRSIRSDPRTADIPVVILSSSDENADIGRCYELGANSFLVKQFDPRGPGTYIAEAARYWLELNRPPPTRAA